MTEHEHCDACDFDGGVFDDDALLAAVRALGPQWQAVLASAGPELQLRPAPEVWSALEYAAHTRDILALHVYGVEQALTLDEPKLPAIEGDLVDAAAVTYAASDAQEVGRELDAQSTRLADVAAAGAGSWSRGLTIGAERIEVRRLLEHALHDATHHLRDVERGFAELRA